MKGLKKFLTGILASAMALTITLSAGSAMNAKAADGSISITPAEGVGADATNTYKIYKVFDAVGDGTNISYKLVPNKTTAPACFKVDGQGNVTYNGTAKDGQLTESDIEAIKAYVTEADLVDTATSKGTAVATSKTLPNGYYFIATGLGSAVRITSTNPNAEVKDKNTTHTVEKIITGASEISADGKKALEQLGQDVTYTATIHVGKGATNLKFHDKMSNGLTFKTGSVTVTGTDAYKIPAIPDNGDTLTIEFDDGIAEGDYTVSYVATVNADAIEGLPNDAYLSYGDNYTSEHSVATVYNAKVNVVKHDGNGNALAGAGFKLKNAEGNYYKLAADGRSASWVSEAEADEYFSAENGNVQSFIGLKNGTYTLTESTVPAGYNKAADETISISGGDFSGTQLIKAVTVVNNAGTQLPATGGIGTTIFYIIGGLLIVAAVVFFVVRRKADAE